jgi:hypothetical protein
MTAALSTTFYAPWGVSRVWQEWRFGERERGTVGLTMLGRRRGLKRGAGCTVKGELVAQVEGASC